MESEKSAEPMDTNESSNNDNDVPVNNQIQIEESANNTTLSSTNLPKTTIVVSNPLTNIVKMKPITSTTVTKIIPSTTLAKIAPKPNASIVKQTSSNSGKLVLIKSPDGTSQTIRISGSTTTSVSSSSLSSMSISGAASGGLRLVKLSDGQVFHLQSKTPTTTVLQRVLVKDSSGAQHIMISKPPSSSSANKNIAKTMASLSLSTANNASTTTNSPRTYTVAQAQQLGLLSASKIKELVTAATSSATAKKALAPISPISTITTTTITTPPINVLQSTTVTTTASASANVVTVTASITTPTVTSSIPTSTSTPVPTSIVVSDTKLKPTVVQQQPIISAQKIIPKITGGMQKQMSLPQNIVKLAQGGQIRAVNVPGRGIQYVRVISNSTTATTTASGTTITSSSDTNKLIATASGASKVLVHSGAGGKQTYTMLPSSSTSSLNSDETKPNKAIKLGAVTAKPIATTQPTLVPINKTQTIVSKVAGPSMAVIAKKEVSANMDKITQFLQANQTKTTISSSATTAPPSSSLIIKNVVKDEPDPIPKREQIASDYRPEKKVYDNLISMEMMPIKSDHDDDDDDDKNDNIADDDNSNSNDNIPINKKTPPSSLPDDAPRRKHCNCTKSQCLKLYCDCFANGEFCFNCTCKECFNNLENETERANAIKSCIDRNPHAFKPKIGKAKDTTDATLRRHTKGCNCKRSGCLKNYCECYEAKICCSANCKCMGCRNVIETFGQLIDAQSIKLEPQTQQSSVTNRKRSMDQNNEPQSLPMASASSLPTASTAKNSTLPPTTAVKKPCNFMTQDVIEATVQCIISQADDCQQQNMDKTTSEKMILEEFGRCLVEIIEFSLKNNDN